MYSLNHNFISPLKRGKRSYACAHLNSIEKDTLVVATSRAALDGKLLAALIAALGIIPNVSKSEARWKVTSLERERERQGEKQTETDRDRNHFERINDSLTKFHTIFIPVQDVP